MKTDAEMEFIIDCPPANRGRARRVAAFAPPKTRWVIRSVERALNAAQSAVEGGEAVATGMIIHIIS